MWPKDRNIYDNWASIGHTNTDLADSLASAIMSIQANADIYSVSNVDDRNEMLIKLQQKDQRILELENEIKMMKEILGIDEL